MIQIPVVLLLALLAPAPAAVRRGGELRLALRAEPRSADPHLARDEPSELLAYLTHGVLVRVNRLTQQSEPELAQSWTATPGAKGIIFTLRPGVKFSDGSSLTPADVCYSVARILEPKLDAMNGDSLRGAAGGVKCSTAAGKVTMTFDKPLVAAEQWFDGIAILPASGKEKTGAGAFRIREWQPAALVVLERNPHYWRRDSTGAALPYLDGLRLEVQRNRDLELMRFERGELDLIMNLNAEQYERLKAKNQGSAISLGASTDTEQMWFNQVPSAPVSDAKKLWFRSALFRQAVSLAIRRDDLVRVAYRGQATPAAGPISPSNRLWANGALKPIVADPAAALALLRRDGFTLSGGVLRDRQGRAVEFSIVTNAGNKARERMAAMIQQDLSALGMQVRVTTLDFPSLIERITRSFDYDACLLSLVGAVLDPNGYMNVWLSSAASHQWNPNQSSPATAWEGEMDRLMQAQAIETNPAARKRAYDRVQAIVAEQVPFISLVHANAMVGVSRRLQGARPALLSPQLLWNADQLWLAAK